MLSFVDIWLPRGTRKARSFEAIRLPFLRLPPVAGSAFAESPQSDKLAPLEFVLFCA